MKNPKRFLLYTLMILFTTLSLAACQADTSIPFEGASSPGISLNITSNICPSVIVTANDQVTWTNQDQQIHLIRIESPAGKTVFDSGDLQPGDAASFVFPQAGDYVYTCSSDQNSVSTITVEP
jgi:plastocyanin